MTYKHFNNETTRSRLLDRLPTPKMKLRGTGFLWPFQRQPLPDSQASHGEAYVLQSKAEFHDTLFRNKSFADDEAVAISFCFADVGIEGGESCKTLLPLKRCG